MVRRSIILALVLMCATAASAFAVDILVTVHNLTGYNLSKLYITPSDVRSWGDNLVDANNTFTDGDTMQVTFSVPNNDWVWDMQATNAQGDTVQWNNLNLHNATDIYLWVTSNGNAEVKVY
jgi:plastocyanin